MLRHVPINGCFEITGFYSAIKFNWSDNFVFNGESHPFWEAVFVESGEVEVTEDENVYTLGAGNLIFHAPMEFHRIKSAHGSTPSGFIFSFTAQGQLPDTLRSGVFTLDPSMIKSYGVICEMIHRFYHFEPLPLLGQDAGARLSSFLIKLDSRGVSLGESMSQSAMEYRRLVSFMSQNVCRNLTLSEVAQENNVSISYVKLLFGTYAGISPKNYFNQLRLKKAGELLSSGMSVTEVAGTMNFSSPNYFSVFYKKSAGISPSEMQKSSMEK